MSGCNHGYHSRNQIELLKLEPSKTCVMHTIRSRIIVTRNDGKSSQSLLQTFPERGEERPTRHQVQPWICQPRCSVPGDVAVITLAPGFPLIRGFADLFYRLRSLVLLLACSPLSREAVNFRTQEPGSLCSNSVEMRKIRSHPIYLGERGRCPFARFIQSALLIFQKDYSAPEFGTPQSTGKTET